MTAGVVHHVHQYVNAQPNFSAQPNTTQNTLFDYEPGPVNGEERWQTNMRDNAELKLTLSKTFWLSVFLSKGKIIEAYHGHNSSE